MPFTGRDTISKIEGFITSNGFIREASSGGYEFKYRDGRDYNRIFFITLLILIPFTAGLTGLAALIYYFTRGRNTLEVSIREDPDKTQVLVTAKGRYSIQTLGNLTQVFSSSLLQGSQPPFYVQVIDSAKRKALGILLIIVGVALLILDIISIRSGGGFLITLAPIFLGYYYIAKTKKLRLNYLTVSYVSTPASGVLPQIQGNIGNPGSAAVANYIVYNRRCLNCGYIVPPDAAVCPNCNQPIERVYAIVHHPDLWRGLRRGYAILITERRVVGKRWFKWQGAVAYAIYHSYYLADAEKGKGPLNLTMEEYQRAYDQAYKVVKDPDFSFDRNMINRVRIRPKGFIRPGYVIIESSGGTVKVNSALKRKYLFYAFLLKGFKALLGDQAVIEE